MATFVDDIKIIETAVYGKEMRPAIVDALTKAKNQISDLLQQSNDLNLRVKELEDDGGGGDKPDPGQTGGSVIFHADRVIGVLVSRTAAIGPATLI